MNVKARLQEKEAESLAAKEMLENCERFFAMVNERSRRGLPKFYEKFPLSMGGTPARASYPGPMPVPLEPADPVSDAPEGGEVPPRKHLTTL